MAEGDDKRVAAEGEGAESARPGTDRRTFVKGMVVGAAAAAAGVAGYALWPKPPVGTEFRLGDKVAYYGAKVQQGSPTEHGVPLLPIAVDDAGFVVSTVDDLTPYTYCRTRRDWRALSEEQASDRWLRYHLSEPQVANVEAQGKDPHEVWWYFDRLGERVHVDDFADKPATTGAGIRFRAHPDDSAPFEGVLVKYDEGTLDLPDDLLGRWPDVAATRPRLVAYDAACTHLCCVAGWHESTLAEKRGDWDLIFCTCHMARFDPFTVEEYAFRLVLDDTVPEGEKAYKASTGRR